MTCPIAPWGFATVDRGLLLSVTAAPILGPDRRVDGGTDVSGGADGTLRLALPTMP